MLSTAFSKQTLQAFFARLGPVQEPGVYPDGSSSGGKRQGDETSAQGQNRLAGLSLVMRGAGFDGLSIDAGQFKHEVMDLEVISRDHTSTDDKIWS